MNQLVLDRSDQCIQTCFDDVHRYTDGGPELLAVGRFDQYTDLRCCTVPAVKYTHLVVGQVYCLQNRIKPLQRLSECAVQCVDRTVSLRCGHLGLTIDHHLDHGGSGWIFFAVLLFAHRFEFLHLEEGMIVAQLFADEHFQRCIRSFKLVSLVLHLLDLTDNLCGHRIFATDFCIYPLNLFDQGAASGHFGHQEASGVSHTLRVNMFKRGWRLVDSVDVHSAFMGKGALSHIGHVFIHLHVGYLGDHVTGLHQLVQIFRRNTLIVSLEL